MFNVMSLEVIRFRGGHILRELIFVDFACNYVRVHILPFPVNDIAINTQLAALLVSHLHISLFEIIVRIVSTASADLLKWAWCKYTQDLTEYEMLHN